jgi:hypothetical protein
MLILTNSTKSYNCPKVEIITTDFLRPVQWQEITEDIFNELF